MHLFLQLLIILLCTKLAGEFSVKLGQPAVLGKLIIGIIIGPAVFGWIQKIEMIDQLSEIGVLVYYY